MISCIKIYLDAVHVAGVLVEVPDSAVVAVRQPEAGQKAVRVAAAFNHDTGYKGGRSDVEL